MASHIYVQVAIDEVTLAKAEELAARLSGSHLRLSRGQILRAALALGVEEITLRPERALNAPARKDAG